MKHAERIAPVAAVLAALSTLLCCLPLGFAAAALTATAGVVLAAARPWLLVAAAILLAIGFVQLYHDRACRRRSVVSIVLLWVCTAIVLVTLIFPQVIATVLA